MIYTYRRYCINTGWMTDGDRSCEVKVRREQRGAGTFSIKKRKKIQYKIWRHAWITSDVNILVKGGHNMQSLHRLVTIVTSAEWCRDLAACPSPCWEGPAYGGCASTPINTVSIYVWGWESIALALDKSIRWPDTHAQQPPRPAHPPSSVLYGAPQGAAPGIIQFGLCNIVVTGHMG